eukprot:c2746_g1_i1 orf=594-770(+)
MQPELLWMEGLSITFTDLLSSVRSEHSSVQVLTKYAWNCISLEVGSGAIQSQPDLNAA